MLAMTSVFRISVLFRPGGRCFTDFTLAMARHICIRSRLRFCHIWFSGLFWGHPTRMMCPFPCPSVLFGVVPSMKRLRNGGRRGFHHMQVRSQTPIMTCSMHPRSFLAYTFDQFDHLSSICLSDLMIAVNKTIGLSRI